ncbi:hypothetical protein T05_4675 [Trichinella murrelli]|uniref:Uncharacterized protein n=1 Tax=Trichinella murrelli TaxID=144512 RepID=A0A0V0U994_9BILA|nr:hypothetical protein T05_4675 [Trichinella murrelli]
MLPTPLLSTTKRASRTNPYSPQPTVAFLIIRSYATLYRLVATLSADWIDSLTAHFLPCLA